MKYNLRLVFILMGLTTMSVCVTYEAEAIKIVQNSVQVDRPLSAELLSGGLSGSSLIKVSTTDQAYVVRFWNMKWAECFPQDFACQVVASDVGYGPKIFFRDGAACLTVIEYIQPETFPEIQLRLQALVDLLKKIHTGPAVPVGLDRAKEIDESIEDVAKLNPQFLDLQLIRKVKEAAYTAIQQNTQLVSCHRDLHPGNLIYSKNRFVAIDYTWGGMADPYTDLATIAIFNCTTLEEEKLLLRLYLGHEPSPEEIARLSLMKLTAQIFYGLEFLKLAPADALKSTSRPNVVVKSYQNFGAHGAAPLSPDDFLKFAVSILNEAIDYSNSKQYTEDLVTIRKSDF
jgi:thiamine kinase